MTTHSRYLSPLGERYASAAMLELCLRKPLWNVAGLWVELEKQSEIAYNHDDAITQMGLRRRQDFDKCAYERRLARCHGPRDACDDAHLPRAIHPRGHKS